MQWNFFRKTTKVLLTPTPHTTLDPNGSYFFIWWKKSFFHSGSGGGGGVNEFNPRESIKKFCVSSLFQCAVQWVVASKRLSRNFQMRLVLKIVLRQTILICRVSIGIGGSEYDLFLRAFMKSWINMGSRKKNYLSGRTINFRRPLSSRGGGYSFFAASLR